MQYLSLLLLTSLALSRHCALSAIVSETLYSQGDNAAIRYHYDDLMSSYVCETVVMMVVGTGMSQDDYETLSTNISTKQPIITVIVDHFPGFFLKSNPKKFARAYEQFMEAIQTGNIVPICKGRAPKKVLIGGHSTGAVAALGAFAELNPRPDGFIGLDPFSVDEKKVSLAEDTPALLWGFKEMTCQVKIQQAAKAAYNLSSKKHRIFYRANNADGSFKHCDFTTHGCGSACPLGGDGSLVPQVAKSIQSFVRAVKKGSFPRDRFILDDTNTIDLFMNEED